jgi:amino acid transporter
MAGVLAIIGPMEVASFIGASGPAAMWPVILGFILFLIVSLPILEYTKITTFTGGYYGLAELGFGRAVGKYTSMTNYVFYLFWQVTNFFAMSAITIDTLQVLYGIKIPIWGWILLGTLIILVTNVTGALHPRRLSKVLIVITTITTMVVVVFIIYVIIKTPFNSTYFLNPANSYSGFKGIAAGTAIYGFFLYVGYGTTLFFSEESTNGRKDVWRAVYLGLALSAIVIALSAYSEVAAVPSSQFSAVSSATLPELVTWIHYVPASALLILNLFVVIISMLSFGAGAGAQSRLMWAMTRDGFIKNKWLNTLSKKNRTPVNSIIFQFIVILIMALTIAFTLTYFYGYSLTTITTAWFVCGSAGTILWYFHHFIPEFGLFPFLNKNSNIKYSLFRKWIIGLALPIAGTALFIYTFYLGIISDLAEPYFAFVIVDLIILLGILSFIVYKVKTKSIGGSTVEYMVTESEEYIEAPKSNGSK